jgi:hypothetical protein
VSSVAAAWLATTLVWLQPTATPEATEPAPEADTTVPSITPKKGPRAPEPEEPTKKTTLQPRATPPELRPAAPEVDLGLWADDRSRLPRVEPPGVVSESATRGVEPLIGVSGALADPPFVDHNPRVSWIPRPASYGHTLKPGERFKYDVYFGGNPTGIAEAAVVLREPGPNGTPDRVRLEASARTSGVVGLLTTIVYEVASLVDSTTGGPIMTGAITKREGMATTYRRREQTATFHGRGYVEIVDDKDGKVTTSRKRLPVDTFDALSIMAWVRSLELEPGGKAKAYGLDGGTLLRVDITSRGPTRLTEMPSIGTALGIAPDQLIAYDGSITRVDRHGAAIPGKKVYKMRVWVSSEGRRIPLVIESDLWLGVVRLILTQYDPPVESASTSGSTAAPTTAPTSPPTSPPSPRN